MNFNNTWSSLVNNTIPTLLPIARFNTTIDNYLLKSDLCEQYKFYYMYNEF